MSAKIAKMYGGQGYDRMAHDTYQTPAWVTSLLLDKVAFSDDIWEPAAGEGYISDMLKVRGHKVFTSDIRECGTDCDRLDFLGLWGAIDVGRFRSIITNPPFSHAKGFIRRALEVTKPGVGQVAMLLPYAYDTALRTRGWMFKEAPFACKIVLGKRIQWIGFEHKASPRQDHAWYVWDCRGDMLPRIIYP